MLKLKRNISVKAKLLSSFLICVVVLILVGGLGMYGIRTVNSNAKEIYQQDFVSVEYLHQLKGLLLGIRTEIDYGVLYEDPENTRAAIKNIEKYIFKEK